jgi:hypothetical protein
MESHQKHLNSAGKSQANNFLTLVAMFFLVLSLWLIPNRKSSHGRLTSTPWVKNGLLVRFT